MEGAYIGADAGLIPGFDAGADAMNRVPTEGTEALVGVPVVGSDAINRVPTSSISSILPIPFRAQASLRSANYMVP